MFGPDVADKYASAVTKNLGLGCDSRPCSACNFLIVNLSSLVMANQACRPWECRNPQILVDQLTLSQPRGADYAHQIMMTPLDFQTFRWPCLYVLKSSFYNLLNNSQENHFTYTKICWKANLINRSRHPMRNTIKFVIVERVKCVKVCAHSICACNTIQFIIPRFL